MARINLKYEWKSMSGNPFEYLNSINFTKENLIVDELTEKDYNPFIINRGLSFFQDTLKYAQDMNMSHFLSKKMQYDFLINIVRKKKRFSKWLKKEKNDKLDIIMEYYKVNEKKAEEIEKLITNVQFEQIKKLLDNGGIIIKKGKKDDK